MKRLLSVVLLTALLSGSCEHQIGKEKGVKTFLRSYIMEYYGIDDITLDYAGVTSEYPNGVIDLRVIDGTYVRYEDVGAKKERYDALCEKHNDMTFNRTETFYTWSTPTRFPDVDFVSIDVVSDADFDNAHPKGSSLKDIMIFKSYTTKPYIDSGYIEYDWGNSGNSAKKPYYPLYKVMSELSGDDLILLGYPMDSGSLKYFATLSFDTPPTLSRTHTFTVTMTADDGRVFAKSVEMTFE
jgi:hypothetical protein